MDSFWLRILFLVMMATVMLTAYAQTDPAEDQLVLFKEMTSGPIGIMTTAAGAPVEYNDTSTLNKRLISNEFFMDSLTHIVRERIPERVVHANGAGAFGYFEVTHDITDICKADLFSKVGKRTPVAVRFSPAAIERGGTDLSRDVRGFAIKFYTKDGNLDIVGFNTPMFTYKDPVKFVANVHTEKRNPATDLYDQNMIWDFLTLNSEALFIFFLVFGDRGIPNGYRHMPGFGIHTFQVVNKQGDTYFVRFHFKTDQGIKNLSSEEAMKLIAVDPDYNKRDLYTAIGNGNFPSWTVCIQVLTPSDVKNAGFDVFDVTKILPLHKYPLRPLGRFVLDKNPVNYFAEIEQLAFCPGNLVPGIVGAPDKVFEARRLSYRDAQYHRLGGNFLKIHVNCPFRTKAFTYNRDGVPPVKNNMGYVPNYYPNSFNGPVAYKEKNGVELIKIVQDEPNNFDQARDLYLNEMSPEERVRLVQNIVNRLRPAAKFLQDRVVKVYSLIHPHLGERIYEGLQANTTCT